TITGKTVTSVTHPAGIHHAVFSPDGQRLLTASQDGTARLWLAPSGPPVTPPPKPRRPVPFAALHPGRGQGGAGAHGPHAGLWDAATGTSGQTLRHDKEVRTAAFSPDGRRVVTACEDGMARLWDVQTGEALRTLRHPSWVNAAWFSPDGRQVVTASGDRTAR